MTLGLFLFLSCFLPYLATLSRPRHVLRGIGGSEAQGKEVELDPHSGSG